MSPKTLHGGRIVDDTWTVMVTPEWHSKKYTGFYMSDEVFDALVDAGVDTIVFVDPNRGRYTSSVDDWLTFATDEDEGKHLRQSWMTPG